MMVVYDSPLQVLCDSPHAYRSSPAGVDLLKIVPTTWDQTKVLAGEVGQFITVARRSGEGWYVGSMASWSGHTQEISLDFLGPGVYDATIWADAADANEAPENLVRETRSVTRQDRISARMAHGGGHVIHLRPQPSHTP